MKARNFGAFVSAGAIVLSGFLGSAQTFASLLASAQPVAPKAYISTSATSDTVSVIDTATNTVIGSPIPTGSVLFGVAVTPDGSKVYVTHIGSANVSVIDTATNTVVGSPIPVGDTPLGVAVTPDGSKVYVANSGSTNVSVIDTATNTVTTTIPVGVRPSGVAVTPDGSKVYVANSGSTNVSVIDTATNTVIGSPIPVVNLPFGVAVTPDGSKVYVTNLNSGNVSVIDTATNTVVGSAIHVGDSPFGVAVSPDGSNVYVANSDATSNGGHSVSVIDTATNTVTDTIQIGGLGGAFGVAVTPDGSKVYVATEVGVRVIDTATNMVTTKIPVGDAITFGVFIANPGVQPAPAVVCADVSGDSLAPQTPVIVHDCHAGPNQQFQWASPPEVPEGPQPAGRIIYAESGHTCLTALGGSDPDETPVVSSPCVAGALAQRWNYASGRVINLKFNKCLDGGELQNLTQLVVNTCNNQSPSQQWRIK